MCPLIKKTHMTKQCWTISNSVVYAQKRGGATRLLFFGTPEGWTRTIKSNSPVGCWASPAGRRCILTMCLRHMGNESLPVYATLRAAIIPQSASLTAPFRQGGLGKPICGDRRMLRPSKLGYVVSMQGRLSTARQQFRRNCWENALISIMQRLLYIVNIRVFWRSMIAPTSSAVRFLKKGVL